ncbi:MAG: type II secretion system F family protein [Candidatus Dormibacteria bacterium]|jgi:type IV pilus assembly protein PilC
MIQAASTEPRRLQLYDYTAVNPDGSVLKGMMEASDPEAVWHAISVRGLRPTGVRAHSHGRFGGFVDQLTKVKLQEVVVFCRQLSTFVRVGIPLTTGLETIAEGAGNKRMRQACASMVADLERGGLLSTALARHPQVFPPVLADLIKASETTGHIDDTLVRCADHFERELQTRTRIRGALMYPAIVLCMALAVATGLVVFVLPQFKVLFDQYGAKLPPIASALLNLSSFISGNAMWILIGLLVAVLGIGYYVRSEGGKYRFNQVLLRVPAVGEMMRAASIERFCRALSDTLSAGVPVGTSFSVVVESTRNPVYRRALRDVGEQVAIGESFSRSLRKTSLFPPLVVQMVKVGEDTGTLDQHLAETARMYDSELDNRLKRLTSIVEPVLIISVGTIVGLVAVSLIQAIYGFASAFKG